MSTLDTTLRILPRLHAPRSWRLVERNIASSRGAWLVFVSGFFEPLFYLFAMGVGVGALVGTVDVDGQAVGYREFVAPALLAASAMNGAVYESGNVFFKLKYAKTYEGVLATPMTVRDVALGELTYTLIRGAVYSFGFVTVMLAMGLLDSPWAVLAIPGALLVSAAFAAPAVFGITLMRSWADFAFVELCTLPMFLFSATFVPADTYPDVVRWILPLTPLYHGVELLRAFTLGDVSWLVLVEHRLPRRDDGRLPRARRPAAREAAAQVATRARTAGRGGSRAHATERSGRAARAPGAARCPRRAQATRRGTPREQRRNGEEQLVDEVCRDERAEDVRAGLAQDAAVAALARGARRPTGRRPRRRRAAARPRRRREALPRGVPAPASVVSTIGASSSTARSGGIDPDAVRIATRGAASRPSSRRSAAYASRGGGEHRLGPPPPARRGAEGPALRSGRRRPRRAGAP